MRSAFTNMKEWVVLKSALNSFIQMWCYCKVELLNNQLAAGQRVLRWMQPQ